MVESSSVWTVCASGCCDYDVIQEAVDNAFPGDTIDVYEGAWEGATIGKYLTIEAQCGLGPSCLEKNRRSDLVTANKNVENEEKRGLINADSSKFVKLAAKSMKSNKKQHKKQTQTKEKSTKTMLAPQKPKKTKKTAQDTICVPDRVKIVSGPSLTQGLVGGLSTIGWKAGFLVLGVPANIIGFKFLCETPQDVSEQDLTIGILAYAPGNATTTSAHPDNSGGGIVRNNWFLECHRGVNLRGTSKWEISNNHFSIVTELPATLTLTNDASQACSAVYIDAIPQSGNYFYPAQGNSIHNNDAIIQGNPNGDNIRFPCSFVTLNSPLSGTALATSLNSFVQATKIFDNKVEMQTVSVGRVVGVYGAWASHNKIFNNEFDSLTYDIFFAEMANHNTVLENHFVGALTDSVYLAVGNFANNITSNEIDSPSGYGINHRYNVASSSTGAHVITYNTILTPGWCAINTPNPDTIPFIPDILYGNFGNLCVEG